MVCHEYKCVFIHVPKVAGQSVHYFFADLLGYPIKAHAPLELKFNIDHENRGYPHLRARDYVDFDFISQEIFDSYFKFAFVRNPWARIVSEYKFRGHPRHIDFKTFLFKELPKPSRDDQYCHIIPQYDFLHDEEGRLLVDYVGKFENVADDFNEVCRRLNIPAKPLPHRNKLPENFLLPRSLKDIYRLVISLTSAEQKRRLKENTRKNYKEYYDNETREFVGNLYQKDIETFDYAF